MRQILQYEVFKCKAEERDIPESTEPKLPGKSTGGRFVGITSEGSCAGNFSG